MALKIMTFGSCFAAFVANCLARLSSDFQRCSSVQHTRIDQFLTGKPVNSRDTRFVPKNQFASVLGNQFHDGELGKSLPYGLPPSALTHPQIAIDAGIDVLLIDNFADMLFRTLRNPKTGQMLYAHRDHMIEMDGDFSQAMPLIDPHHAVAGYASLHHAVQARQPSAVSVFLNFPMNLKEKPLISERSEAFEVASMALWNVPGFGVVDLAPLCRRDLNVPTDTNHFSKRRYLQYAFQVAGLIHLLREKRMLRSAAQSLFADTVVHHEGGSTTSTS